MAGSLAETTQEKFLREKQEYEDALAAYHNVLGRAASTVQIPYAMQSNYSVENQGYERAATDPWISDRFPELKAAAERVQAEEQEFLALDDPFPSHANNQCSISSYTAQKVYEYYALFETVYLLATDAAFRAQVVAQIEAFLTGSGFDHYMAANNLQNQADILMLGKPDLLDYWLSDDAGDEVLRQREQEIDRQLEVIGQQTAFHMSVVEGKIAEFFKAVWQDLKQKYYDCGILYAVSTVGVDGIFVAAEIYSGLAFLRFLKFGLRALPKAGQIVVDILDGNGRKIGTRTHSQAALEAKYGKPQENGVGGYAPDTNRDIPDSPAEDVLEQQRRDRERGEVRQDQRADGSYRNPDDPDGVRRTADGEAMIQNKDGTWRPVSDMSDPARAADNGRRHNPQVGRWGEVEADRYAANQGWEKINGPNTTMDSPFTGPGKIDAIYRDPGPPPRYIVSDAKALGSQQGKTKDDVLQMSGEWIKERLGGANLSRFHQREMADGFEPVLLRVDKNGNVTEEWLDVDGKKIPAPSWRDK
ncbi:hypothetical protein [Tritonibacter mobilis]|uniref:hypothetical protein n=1 Tax=Tritonibacter mobilis TaxID=379347 RepID=UPI0039A71128